MRKILYSSLITIIVLILAIIFISPYFIGQHIESMVKQKYSDTTLANGINVKLLHYQRGWFRSTATFAITESNENIHMLSIDHHAIQDNNVEFIIPVTILQGPINWYQNSSGKHAMLFGFAALAGQVELEPNNNKVAHIDGHLSFAGDLQLTLRTPRYTWQVEQEKRPISYALDKLKATLFTNVANVQKVRVAINIGHLHIIDHQVGTVQLSHVYNQYTKQKVEQNLWLAKQGQLNIKQSVFKPNTMTSIKIKALQFHFANKELQQHLQGQINLTIASISQKLYTLGPIVAKLHLRANSFATLARLKRLLETQHTFATDAEFNQFILKAVLPLIQGAKLTLQQCQIITPQGTIKLNGNIQLPDDIVPTTKKTFTKQQIMLMVASMIESTRAKLNIMVPIKLVDHIIAQQDDKDRRDLTKALQAFLGVGYLRQQGTNYVSKLNLTMGSLYANGISLKTGFKQNQPAQPTLQPNSRILPSP